MPGERLVYRDKSGEHDYTLEILVTVVRYLISV